MKLNQDTALRVVEFVDYFQEQERLQLGPALDAGLGSDRISRIRWVARPLQSVARAADLADAAVRMGYKLPEALQHLADIASFPAKSSPRCPDVLPQRADSADEHQRALGKLSAVHQLRAGPVLEVIDILGLKPGALPHIHTGRGNQGLSERIRKKTIEVLDERVRRGVEKENWATFIGSWRRLWAAMLKTGVVKVNQPALGLNNKEESKKVSARSMGESKEDGSGNLQRYLSNFVPSVPH